MRRHRIACPFTTSRRYRCSNPADLAPPQVLSGDGKKYHMSLGCRVRIIRSKVVEIVADEDVSAKFALGWYRLLGGNPDGQSLEATNKYIDTFNRASSASRLGRMEMLALVARGFREKYQLQGKSYNKQHLMLDLLRKFGEARIDDLVLERGVDSTGFSTYAFNISLTHSRRPYRPAFYALNFPSIPVSKQRIKIQARAKILVEDGRIKELVWLNDLPVDIYRALGGNPEEVFANHVLRATTHLDPWRVAWLPP